MKILLVAVYSLVLLLATVNSVSAALQARPLGSTDPVAYCDNASDVDVYGFKCLEGVFFDALKTIITLVGIGAFIFLIIGGMRYITAGGDQKGIDSAKKTLTYAVVGFFLSIIIFFIYSTLLGSFGLRGFLQFRIPCNAATKGAAAGLGVPQLCPVTY